MRLFGSYAKGTATTRSDIDIAYDSELLSQEFAQVWSRLRYDAPFLMRCDIVAYDYAPRTARAYK